MDFDPTEVQPKLSNWLELNVRYEGQGKAEFTSPEGQVFGPFVAEFTENGDSRIETRYDSLISADPDYGGADLPFITGAKVQNTSGGRSFGIGGIEHHCRELSFSTSNGVFSASNVRLVGYTFGQSAILRFRVRDAKFETGNPNPPKYFAIPLLNFVAELGNRLVAYHPLRIYPTPVVPESVPEEYKRIAGFVANAKNSGVAFTSHGRLHFIERLSDYEERHASLQSGTQRKVTAVLVGDIGSQPTSTFTDFLSWFPSDLLSALSFASGTEVGRLWIEIRDENGTLIRRLHGKSQLPSFWEGDELLEKYDRMDGNAAMGEFVAAYLAQPPDKRFYLEMAMNHARFGSILAPFHLHDILDHLIRGLECLCREHKLVQQNLGSALSSKTRASVQAIVNEARLGLQKLADNSAASSALDEHRMLTVIKSRAENWHTTENNFGLSVVALLQNFGF